MMLATCSANSSTNEEQIQESIAHWSDEKSAAFLAKFEAYALEVLGAEALAEIKASPRR